MKTQTLKTVDSVEFCKAMADDTRQGILRLLRVRDTMSAGEIVAAFKLSQPTISHHLSILRRYGLVRARHKGKEVVYTLDQENITECCGMLMAKFVVVPEKELYKKR